jgi:restriction system protein
MGRHGRTAGNPEIRWSASRKRAKKGVFIITGRFSEDAVKYVESIDPNVILIDRRTLAEVKVWNDVDG